MASFNMADEIRIIGNEMILPASSFEVHALWLPVEWYPQFPNLRDHSGANMPFNEKKNPVRYQNITQYQIVWLSHPID